jgi:hypothetical protein
MREKAISIRNILKLKFLVMVKFKKSGKIFFNRSY